MAIPAPEPVLVISYAYLWDREAQDGREEGRKDRPCVITLAAQRQQDGATWVTVLPVTHSAPKGAASAVEIPPAVKRCPRSDTCEMRECQSRARRQGQVCFLARFAGRYASLDPSARLRLFATMIF